jgi:hypothetical protein
MKFKEIVSITGLSGLYQLLATKSDGAIVKSIEDNSTKFVAARSHSVTSLDGIEVFTTADNMRLFDVFLTMKANATSAGEIDLGKANNNDIKAHYAKLFPQFDADRVYVSDMKKMIKWMGILNDKNLLVTDESSAETAPVPVEIEEAAAEKPAKKAAKKKAAVAEGEDATEAAPKPKKAAKKKTDAETKE